MNVMESWLEAIKLYKKSRPKLARELFLSGGLRNTWRTYALLLAMSLLVYFQHGRNPSSLENLAMLCGAMSWAWGVFLIKERCQQIVYSKQYDTYKIKKYALLRRESILRYALLYELLKNEGYSAKNAEKLLTSASAATDPQKTNIASQSLTIGLLTSAAITITTNLLAGTEIWKNNKGILYLIPIAIALYIAYLIIDFVNTKEHRNRLILNFLGRAIIDLKEAESLINPEDRTEDNLLFDKKTKKTSSHPKPKHKTRNPPLEGVKPDKTTQAPENPRYVT